MSSIAVIIFIFYLSIQLTIQQTTTTFFSCYTCTNDAQVSQTNLNYPNDAYVFTKSVDDCGSTFNSLNSDILQLSNCNTTCLKRETGILGSKLTIERRCVKTCTPSDSSYSIKDTNPKYIIDRISCCNRNLCNDATRTRTTNNLLLLLSLLLSIIKEIVL